MLLLLEQVINTLCEDAYFTAKSKGFYEEGQVNLGERTALIHTEVSELLQELRNPILDKDRAAEEAADIILRVASLCKHLDLNLGAAVNKKRRLNKLRPRMHGKLF